MLRLLVLGCLLATNCAVPLRACALGVACTHLLRSRQCVAAEPRGRKKKTMRLHDIKRDESQGNEYYAGGIDDQGHGSGTVLLYPRDEYANVTSTNNETDAPVNASSAEEATPFKGQGRSLR